eukprot:2807050-Rhodomonas_salina.2
MSVPGIAWRTPTNQRDHPPSHDQSWGAPLLFSPLFAPSLCLRFCTADYDISDRGPDECCERMVQWTVKCRAMDALLKHHTVALLKFAHR